MTNSKSTKRALVFSALAILMCAAMLIGTTFAWFTDTASTGVNKIQAGNLKMEVSYKNTADGTFTPVDKNTPVLNNNALWEPGHVEYVVLKVENVGNLALKYKLGINIAGETGSTNVNGEEFKLSDYIRYAVVTGEVDVSDRDTLVAAAKAAGSKLIKEGYSKENNLNATNDADTVTLVVWMPTDVGNDANHKVGATAPEIKLGINVAATQYTYESDSFGSDYDANADMTPDNLDIVTVDGVAYDSLTAALENASEGSVITLRNSVTEPLKLENTEPITVKGVTFKGEAGVTIKGLQLSAAKAANMVTLEDVTFEDVTFTDRVVLGQSTGTNGNSRCSNITFVNCTFDMSDSTEKYKDAIYRGDVSVTGTITAEKEANAYLDGLTVKNCEFKNTRNAIKGGKVRNVTVEGCKFTDSTAVAIYFRDVAGTVLISGNTADNTNGVLEINTVGNNYSTTNTETEITVKGNTATNMTCNNGYVFCTGFDNAKASGKSVYTITGNSCTYTQDFDAPLNGFRIKSTYGPSKAEFIENQ